MAANPSDTRSRLNPYSPELESRQRCSRTGCKKGVRPLRALRYVHSRFTPPNRARGITFLLVALIALSSVGAGIMTSPRPALAASATTTTDLNLRAGASFGDRVLTVMPGGASVSVDGDPRDGFYPVTYRGTSGWAFGSYLSIAGESTASGTGTATTTSSLNLRTGPSTGNQVITVMPGGAQVSLTGNSQNGFLSVSYNGRDGWAHSDYLSTGSSGGGASTAATTGSGNAKTTTDLNLRAGPGTNNRVLLVMPGGSTVTVTGDPQNDFYPLTYRGTSGWAHGSYLSINGSGSGDSGSANRSNVASDPAPRSDSAPSAGGPSGSNLSKQEVIEIIYAAADRYGQSREDMLRVARCESNLNPKAVNPTGSYGLFQFIRSTWATTPYANYDILDAWASANAAGWMWSVGRRGEWVCK